MTTSSARLTAAREAHRLHPPDAPPQGAPRNLPELLAGLASPLLRPAAVLVALIPREAGTQVLLTVRNLDLAHHAGQVSFPGGRVEPGESLIECALREASEEVGLEAHAVELVGFLDPIATISGFRVTPVVAHVSAAARFRADPREVAEIFEVPLAHLRHPATRGVRVVKWRGLERQTGAYQHAVHDIWGVTASILDGLLALPHADLERTAR